MRRTAVIPVEVTDLDRKKWFEASQERPPKELRREDIIAILTQKNFVRVRRLQKDYRWMQKQLIKMGRNPEDAKWLLQR